MNAAAPMHTYPWCDDLSWFAPLREELSTHWHNQCETITGSACDAHSTLMFEGIVDSKEGHISLARSLIAEQMQIQSLLNASAFDSDPALFWRMLLFLLDEFCNRIEACFRFFGGNDKAPRVLSRWNNTYGKHRTLLFLQHFLVHLFEDNPGNSGVIGYIRSHAESASVCLLSGFIERNLIVFDGPTKHYQVICEEKVEEANESAVPVLIVPPLQQQLDLALSFYQDFVILARSQPEKVRLFQSKNHWPVTPEVEDEILRNLGMDPEEFRSELS